MEFELRYGAGPHEVWDERAASRLEGTKTVVTYRGARTWALIRRATVSSDRRSLLLLLEAPDLEEALGLRLELPLDVSSSPCERKVRFATEEAAKVELVRIIQLSMTGQRERTRHVETGYYECPLCGGWHLSSRPWDEDTTRELRRRRGRN